MSVCSLAVLNVSDENTRIFVLPALAFRCISCSLDVYPHTEQNSRAGRSLEIATAVLTAFSRAAFGAFSFGFSFILTRAATVPVTVQRLLQRVVASESSGSFLQRFPQPTPSQLRVFIQILCNRRSKKKTPVTTVWNIFQLSYSTRNWLTAVGRSKNMFGDVLFEFEFL